MPETDDVVLSEVDGDDDDNDNGDGDDAVSTIEEIDGTNDALGADELLLDDDVKSDEHLTKVEQKSEEMSAVNGELEPAKAEFRMEAVLKTMNKHLKQAVKRLKGDDAKVGGLKRHVGDIVEEVMMHSTKSVRLEEAVESAILRFEKTGSYVPLTGNGSSGAVALGMKPNLAPMQFDSELSLEELVNYLTDEIDNEHRKSRGCVTAVVTSADAIEAAKEVVTLPVPDVTLSPVCPEVRGADVLNAVSDCNSDEAKSVSMDKSKLFSEMEDKFAKETDSVLKTKSIISIKKKSDPDESRTIPLKEPGVVELKDNAEVVVVVANNSTTIEDPSHENEIQADSSVMLMSPGARSDGAVDKDFESESESATLSQSSDLVKSLRKVRVKRSRNSSSNNQEAEASLSPMEVDDPSPPRLIRPRLLMSPPASMPDLTSQNQTSPQVMYSSLQIEIPDNGRRGPVSGSNRLTPRMSPATAAARKIEVSPRVLSKVDAEAAAAAVQFTPLSPRISVIVPSPQPQMTTLQCSPLSSPVTKQNGDQSQVSQAQPSQQHQPLASLKTVIRVPKTLSSTPITPTITSSSINSSLTPSLISGLEFSTSSKKKTKRKNLPFVAESDGGLDTAEEEELSEQYQRKKRSRNNLMSDNEYDGRSADESNTDGGGKQSPDSAATGKSGLDDKLTE